MSESDGLHKLTAYLNQTRRQAEAAVDALNVQIVQLQKENAAYEALCAEIEEEKEQYRNQVEQMKLEGTMKHRLQERDDWRSLIESVQKDRARLQEECNALESTLELAKEEITDLQEKLDKISNERKSAADPVGGDDSARGTPSPGKSQRGSLSIISEGIDDPNTPTLMSPILDRYGNEVSINFSETPRNIVGQLKLELKKAYAQLAAERQQAEAAQLSYRLEISRLQEEVDSTRPQASHSTHQYGLGNSAQRTSNGSASNGALTVKSSALVTHRATRPIEWLNPLGYFDYWFSGTSNSALDQTKANKIIIQV